MTEKDNLQNDDMFSNALKGLDRHVEVRPAEIAQHLLHHRKRGRFIQKVALAGVCIIGLGVVLAFTVVSWPESNDLRSEALAGSKPAEAMDSTRGPTNRSAEIASADSPVLESINREALQSLKAERDRLRREVAELSARQAERIRRQMRNAASVTLVEPTQFVNAF